MNAMTSTPLSTDTGFSERLQTVKARIRAACDAAGRKPESVKLLAVSKTFPAEAVAALAGCGQQAFGENYVQESVDKIATLRAAGLAHLEWHFIGPLQSNKSRLVAENFDWVHTVDRERLAQRLSEQRPAGSRPLNVCIQVKTSTEDTKHGCNVTDVDALAAAISALPHLSLRGLMTLPQPGHEAVEFAQLQQLFVRLQSQYPDLDTLSMGMSSDLETAIAHGSTCVRVGTALFGNRPAFKSISPT